MGDLGLKNERIEDCAGGGRVLLSMVCIGMCPRSNIPATQDLAVADFREIGGEDGGCKWRVEVSNVKDTSGLEEIVFQRGVVYS